jgi:hypothetical protein
MFTHEQIERDSVVEQYVRRQLDLEQREQFEAHFFSCDECFDQVQTFERFLAGIRYAGNHGLLHNPPATQFRSWMRPAFALAAAAVVILALAISFNSTEQKPSSPVKSSLDPGVPVAILAPDRETEISVPATAPFILLRFETPSDDNDFSVTIKSQSDTTAIVAHLRRDSQGSLSISVASSSLPYGLYTVRMSASGLPDKPIAIYTLLVKP